MKGALPNNRMFSLLALMLLWHSPGFAQGLGETQQLVERWVSLEQQNTALTSSWRNQRQLLEQRQQLLADEKQQLQDILDNSSQDSDEVESRRAELLDLQNTMEQDQAALQNSLQTAMNTVRSLLSQLPPPLQNSWQEKLAALPTDGESGSAENASQTLQVVLELLGQLDDFKRRISINEAPITLADGRTVLVKQLYLGASHAWYVSADGTVSGYGQSTAEGWRWLQQPAVDGSTVQAAIAMLERNANVALVNLPLTLPKPPDLGSASPLAQTLTNAGSATTNSEQEF